MKKYHAWILYLSLVLSPCVASTGVTAQRESRGAQIVERGAHHRKWVNLVSTVDAAGRRVVTTNSYTELATGLHYWKDGQWAESKEVIDIVPGGALASHGPHQVGFAANINTPGAINLLTADGKRLRSHVLGLAYTDATTGQSVLIAELKDSIGMLVRENQIVYQDAFDTANGVRADVRYTYTRGGLEQDVILLNNPPGPETYGLDPATTRLEVITEFVEAPEPVVASATPIGRIETQGRANMDSPEFLDQELTFGSMRMGPGQAFPLSFTPDSDQAVPTGKAWEKREGRTFLIEAVQYPEVKRHLDEMQAELAPKKEARATPQVKPGRTFPVRSAQAKNGGNISRMAAGPAGQKGFVIDYVITSGVTNFTFAADTTYYVGGSAFTLWGTNTIIEGGTVIKYTNGTVGPQLRFADGLVCQTSPYRPAIATSMHDNTVGATISGSTGNPTNYCGIMFYLGSGSANYFNLHDIHVAHAYRAFFGITAVKVDLSNCQVRHAHGAFNNNTAFWNLRNILVSDTLNAFTGAAPLTNNAEHMTFFSISNLVASTVPALSPIKLTNSLLIGVTNGVSYVGSGVEMNLDGTGIFQTAGCGSFYLATNSAYRDAGTTNINPALLSSLRQRTTLPPVVFSNVVVNGLMLSPLSLYDTEEPDLGYHYDVLDYLVSGLTVSNAVLLLTNGVTVGLDYSAGSWAIILQDSKVISEGNPTGLNRLVRAHLVQERSAGNPATRALFYDGAGAGVSNELRMRFTLLAQSADDGYMLYTGRKFSALEWTHSAIYNSSLVIDTGGSNSLSCGLTNSLWERGAGQLGLASSSSNTTVHVRNNLFKHFYQHFVGASSSWSACDNVVDRGGFNDHGSMLTNRNNAYYLALTNLSGGTSNLSLTNLAYVSGPLGDYYQPTNSLLISRGSVTADLVSLYHFTALTNQVKESNSVVEIGLHYASLNTDGRPVDTDGEGISDYLEDRNGNGLRDGAENDWKNADTDGDGLNDAVEMRRYFTNPLMADTDGDGVDDYLEALVYRCNPNFGDSDGDGLTDFQETQTYHTNPLVRDTDGDGISDFTEITLYGTNPNIMDTDGDRLSDADEIFRYLSNPLLADGNGDGIPDTWDLVSGNLDIDQDGMIDTWETLFGLNLEPSDDPDSDGLSNLDEFVLGTDPNMTDGDGDGIMDGFDAEPFVSAFSTQIKWFEDATPGTALGQNEVWRWMVSDYPWPVSGSYVHVSKATNGFHEHSFSNAPTAWAVAAGDALSTYVYLDSVNPPREIMLKWTASDGTQAAAYWGEDMINAAGKIRAGELPPRGKWVLLQASADSLGLAGKQLKGMAFALYDGWAMWNRTGKVVGDSDADGLNDEWERRYYGNLTQSATGDPDADGLTNLQEFNTHTDPTVADTDEDGLLDGEEMLIGTDPLRAMSAGNTTFDGFADADNDGLINMQEFAYYGSDPKNAFSLDSSKQANDAQMKLAQPYNVTVTPLKLAFVSVVSGSGLNWRLDGTSVGVNYIILSSTVWPAAMQYEKMIAGAAGSTSFFVPFNGRSQLFLQAGVGDEHEVNGADGLPDAYEVLITHTSPDLHETIPGLDDGMADYNRNGIDNYHEYIMSWKIGIYASDANATETGLPGEVTITLPRPAPVGGLAVSFYDSASGGATYTLFDEAGNTLTSNPKTVTIPAGRTDYRVRLVAVNDNVSGSVRKIITLTLRNTPPPTGYATGEVDQRAALINISDDEAPPGIVGVTDVPTVEVNVVDSDARETSDLANTLRWAGFTIVRSAGANVSVPLTVNFQITGTATRGKDYRLLESDHATPIGDSVTIPAGYISTTVVLEALDDLEPEFMESAVLSVEPSLKYILKIPYSGTVWVDDNESPIYTLSAETNACDSSAIGGSVIGAFKITRTGPIRNSASSSYACTLSGTAVFGTYVFGYSPDCDYTVEWQNGLNGTAVVKDQSTFFASFPANSATNWVRIIPRLDSVAEGESVELTLSGVLPNNQVQSIAIYDAYPSQQDVHPIALRNIKVDSAEDVRGDNRSSFRIIRVDSLDQPWNIPNVPPQYAPEFEVFFKVGGTADPVADYNLVLLAADTSITTLTRRAANLFSVILPQGLTELKINVASNPDAVAEPIESIIVSLLPGDYPIGKQWQADMRIRDAGKTDHALNTDGDGVRDNLETVSQHTDALSRDSNGDGIQDGLNLSSPADFDDDGISNLIDFILMRVITDVDDDGISDSREMLLGTDPTTANSLPNDQTPPKIVAPLDEPPQAKVDRL